MQQGKPMSGPALLRLSLIAILPVLWSLIAGPAATATPWIRALEWGAVLVVGLILLRWVFTGQPAGAGLRLPGLAGLRRSEVESFFQQRPEVTVILDPQGRILRCNTAFRALVDLPEDQLTGRRFDEIGALQGVAEYDFWEDARHSADRGKAWSQQTWGQRADGSLFPEQIMVRALRDAAGAVTGYTFAAFDVSDLVMTKKELERSALQDPLTGLFNRRYLEAEAEQAIERCRGAGQNLGLLLLDLDDFKSLNDRRGHQFGDEVLTHVAETLRGIVPLGDIISRLGGDEFVVVAEDVAGPDAVHALAEEIRGALSLPFAIQDETLRLSVSVGASLFPEDGLHFEELLGRADAAMYQSKQLGRNRVSLFAAARAALERPSTAEFHAEDLDDAVGDDCFVPYYQPIVDLATREMIGAEALCRWQHPRHGLLRPAAFISTAETNGMIREIDRAIIRKVCAQMADWNERARGRLPISVNVSAATLTEPGFVRFLSDCCEEFGVSTGDLVIELTESMLLLADDPGRRSLARLRELGLQIALDDFGTGFSTLSLLKDLPVTRLKIDRSFVAHIDTNRRDREIVSSIVSLGHALGTDVVVEGVETESQAEMIAGIGDTIAQGYLFGKPMPAAELAACANWNCDGMASRA
ncbi:putative bifunctional diguanylate cyclase/phosphodiesterase [Marinibacterium sp. SX1]|uniref:putative bifunctional diguanylate cyclase/phosphodiesterase n=1 Tax=Marinibacterium sp. SX1 TaxID=3388424 RepID=UPI003D1624A0